MSFKKTEGYFINKIENIEKAIDGTKKALVCLTAEKQIQAHESQIKSYIKSLEMAKKDFANWKLWKQYKK